MRPDLQVSAQWFTRRRHWTLKDPLTLKYFHLLDEEYAILQMLDGQTSLAEIKRRYDEQFVPQRLNVARLQGLLGDLNQKGMLLVDAPGRSEHLLQRRTLGRRRAWMEYAGNLLAIRLPGLDPERLLAWLAPHFRWAFTRTALAVWLLIVMAATLLSAVKFHLIQDRLSNFSSFFTMENLAFLMVALATVKIFHELSHALACKHYGGECHEIGIMLLVFTPCLYCDVSDAWLLPSKWQRIAISAAGIFTEIFLAAMCAFLWWFTYPGFLNSLALNVMLVCSLGTVVFNGNPLMRFDGYYILADLVEVPNLRARAQSALLRLLARVLLGMSLPAQRVLAERHSVLLAGYAVASIVYRCLVVVGIFYFLRAALAPYRLQAIALVFIVVTLFGMVAVPVWRFVRFLYNPLMRQQIQRRRLIIVFGLLMGLLVAAWSVPLPCRVQTPLVLDFMDAERVYVTQPGSLSEAMVQGGDAVQEGAELARLIDWDMQRKVARLTNDRDRQKMHLEHLKARQGDNLASGDSIPRAERALQALNKNLEQLVANQQMLVLTAPIGGTVIAPPLTRGRPVGETDTSPPPTDGSSAETGRLVTWSGTPLDPSNQGCYLPRGTLFCLVGSANRLEAVAIVDHADIDLVQQGQRVKIQLNQAPNRIMYGTVLETAKIDADQQPEQLVAIGEVAAQADQSGVLRPLTTAYQARIELDEHDQRILAGAPGRGKITVDPQPLGRRLLRHLRRTFRFDQ